MKILKYLLLLLLILIIGVSIYIAVQPNDYSFSRSKVIAAPQAVVFNKVNDYKYWPEFSPWIEQEPEAKLTYKEITKGKGAGYSWNGEILGIGSMSTLDSDPNHSIEQKITFVEPFDSESNINWSFEPVDGGTKVSWSMNGKQDFMTKMFTTFMGSIEKNTGPDFERGLFKLDSIVTKEIKQYSVAVDGITEHSGGFYLYTSTSSKIDNLSKKISEVLPKVSNFAMSNNVSMAGPPFLMYHEWDQQNNAVRFSACVPTTSRVVTTDNEVLTGQLQPFKAVKVTLNGDYSNLQEAWAKAKNYIENDPKIIEVPNGPQLEVYASDPIDNPNPSQWITEIYIAIEEL